MFFATACGLGNLKPAPGTWGSLAGVLIFAALQHFMPHDEFFYLMPYPQKMFLKFTVADRVLWSATYLLPVAALIAVCGVLVSDNVAKYFAQEDPQFVVIDEVSGQFLTYLFALAPLNWKYLLLGFILFRAFDIWKPFPARQAESLPGGWGIMADDWVAGIYAAALLWIARAAGL
jgi:phosphatidylglycerophosphatase A